MIALRQGLECRFDHDIFGRTQQAENGVVVFGHDELGREIASVCTGNLSLDLNQPQEVERPALIEEFRAERP